MAPLEPTEAEENAKQQARELHERDPERYPAVEETMEYEFFLTETPSEALKFKRKFDPMDPDNEDDDLYTQKDIHGEGCYRFKRIRAYETSTFAGSPAEKYDDEVVIAIHDGSDGVHQKGAYYYPIVQKASIRPQRTKNIQSKKWSFAGNQEDEIKRQTDFVDVKVEEPDEKTKADRDAFITYPYGPPVDEEDGDAEKNGSATPERD